MLKLSGAIMIMLGIIGILNVWEEHQKIRRRHLWGIYHLLVKGENALVKERIKCSDFLGHVTGNEPLICEACRIIEHELKLHNVRTGEIAWNNVWQGYQRKLMLSQEEENFLYSSGRAFFGKNVEEIEQLFELYKQQCLRLIEGQKREYLEKRKVMIPVGILGGIVLIILLI